MRERKMGNKEEWVEMDKEKSQEFSKSFIRRAEKKIRRGKEISRKRLS